MNTLETAVLVVGSGPAGGTMALALASYGIDGVHAHQSHAFETVEHVGRHGAGGHGDEHRAGAARRARRS